MTESTQSAIRRGHPGAGKKRTRRTPKGRQVDPTALEEVRAEGPARQGRRRYWHRGALMELIDIDFIQGSIRRRLADMGRESII